jgi:hypothetical protein
LLRNRLVSRFILLCSKYRRRQYETYLHYAESNYRDQRIRYTAQFDPNNKGDTLGQSKGWLIERDKTFDQRDQ